VNYLTKGGVDPDQSDKGVADYHIDDEDQNLREVGQILISRMLYSAQVLVVLDCI